MTELKELLGRIENLSYLYNRLDELNPMCPIGEQMLNLGEDLFQAQFEDGTVVDVGFYPWSSDGAFKVSVLREGNWDEPVKQYECKELNELYTRLEVTLVEVSTYLKKKGHRMRGRPLSDLSMSGGRSLSDSFAQGARIMS